MSMNRYDCIEQIKKGVINTVNATKDLEKYNEEYAFEELINAAEKGLKVISELHLSQRELVLALYDAIPSFPHDIERIESNALHIAVEKLNHFEFPVYRLTMPYLIPNKRDKKVLLKNAITDAVNRAVVDFCESNNIEPFEYATIIFVSSYEGENLNIDNDNKESVVITNGLIGNLIWDDRSSSCNSIYYSRKTESGTKTEIYIVDSKYDIEVYTWIKSE